MKKVLLGILGVVVGLIVGMALNMAFIMLNWALFPMPEGMDMNDPDQMNAYVRTLPLMALLIVVAAHQGQSLVGGWIAARLGESRPMLLAMIVGVLTMAGGIANMTMIEHPPWMYVEVPLYLVVAWLAGSIEVKRRDGSAPSE